MTYQEIRSALKVYQTKGHPVPALNSKKEVLEIALKELQAMPITTVVEEIAEAPKEITPAVAITEAPTVTTEPTPVIEQAAPIPQWITPQHPAITELRELAMIAEITLVWSIALVRSLIRFSTPHLKRLSKNLKLCLHKAMEDSLRTVVVAGVLWEVWLVPKIQLIAYTVGLWAVLVAIRIKKRGVAIA